MSKKEFKHFKKLNVLGEFETEGESNAEVNQEAFHYWIHCNYCYDLYYQKNSPMYILSCRHILCQKCLENEPNRGFDFKNNRFTCLICCNIVRRTCIRNNMPPYLKELFHPMPWLKDLPTARIFEFQQPHRDRLQNAMRKVADEHDRLVREDAEAREMEKNLLKELRLLKLKNARLECRVRPLLKEYSEMKLKKKQTMEANRNSRQAWDISTSQCARTAGNRYIPDQKSLNFSSLHGDNTTENEFQDSGLNSNSKVLSFIKTLPNTSFKL